MTREHRVILQSVAGLLLGKPSQAGTLGLAMAALQCTYQGATVELQRLEAQLRVESPALAGNVHALTDAVLKLWRDTL